MTDIEHKIENAIKKGVHYNDLNINQINGFKKAIAHFGSFDYINSYKEEAFLWAIKNQQEYLVDYLIPFQMKLNNLTSLLKLAFENKSIFNKFILYLVNSDILDDNEAATDTLKFLVIYNDIDNLRFVLESKPNIHLSKNVLSTAINRCGGYDNSERIDTAQYIWEKYFEQYPELP